MTQGVGSALEGITEVIFGFGKLMQLQQERLSRRLHQGDKHEKTNYSFDSRRFGNDAFERDGRRQQ